MNEFFKKIFARIAALWGGWSIRQKGALVAFGVIIIVAAIALFRVSSSPVMVSVIDAPIRDQNALDRIVLRINEENVKVTVTPGNLVQVADENTARRIRAILIREDLIPSGIDPWNVFDKDRWTYTDFERNVNFQQAQRQMIINHIRSIEGVDDANVNIGWPERELFRSEQKPVTASVIITPSHMSDITRNRRKIEGIQKLLKYAVVGLQDEFIVITDNTGMELNNFEDMAAFDRLTLIQREARFILDLETRYRALVLNALQTTFSRNRVRDLNIKIDMDLSKKTIDTNEIFPIVMQPRTPGLPYDDSRLLEKIIAGETTSDTSFTGTGFNPEGPPGVEGQTPPAHRDMSNLYGTMNQTTEVRNYEWNNRSIQEERSPSIDRLTVSVNIDGIWNMKFDEKGNPVIVPGGRIEREYTPIPEEDRRGAEALIRNAVGYSSSRGDAVVVTNIAYDRTEEFQAEDAEYFRKKQMQTTIIVFISGLTLLLFGFILFRVISREMERRRRLAEEERARRQQMLRESAMAEAEQEGMEVSISMEERSRMELMENVINMAKEHPEDAAQLIRTWLLEE